MIPGAWAPLRGLPVAPARDGGLINQTWLVGEPPAFVAQRVNPIFGPEVHDDIAAVTRRLVAYGLPTPELLPTDAGALFARDEEGAVWRVLTFVPGLTLHRVDRPALAFSAGALVARFHAALDDFAYTYRHDRDAHNTALHWKRLGEAPESSVGAPLAREILAACAAWKGELDLPRVHTHGDLKISNLRFDGDGKGVCLLDLDTLAKWPLAVEMGDAFRSWCNPVGEDSLETYFDADLFLAAVAGYRSVRAVDAAEMGRWIEGTERIALELAARFCRDAWEDRYFGWNAERFPSRVAHNLYRARGQLNLARVVHAMGAELRAAV